MCTLRMAFHLLSNAMCVDDPQCGSQIARTAAFALATSNIPASDPQYSGNGHKHECGATSRSAIEDRASWQAQLRSQWMEMYTMSVIRDFKPV